MIHNNTLSGGPCIIGLILFCFCICFIVLRIIYNLLCIVQPCVKYRSELKLYKEKLRCMKDAKRDERPAKTT